MIFERKHGKRSFGFKRIGQDILRGVLAASLALSPFTSTAAHADIFNRAGATAETPRGTLVTSPPAEETVITAPPGPAFVLNKTGSYNDVDASGTVNANDTIDYVVTAENVGNTVLTGVSANDPLVTLTFDVASDTNNNGELDIGETWVWNATYVIPQGVIDTNGGGDGDIDNTVTVSTNELPDQTDSFEFPLNGGPGIEIAKTADISGLTNAGDPITYTITATNTGVTTLTNVVVTDTITTPNSITCPSVAPTATCVLTGTYLTTDADFIAGSVDNTADVTTDDGVGDTITVTTPLTASPALTVDKSVSPGAVSVVGAPVTYTVLVENTGNVTLTGLTVADPLVALDCGSGLSTIASLAPGASQTCSAVYPITQADFDAGALLNNTVTVTDDGTWSISETDTAVVSLLQNPDFAVTKTGTLNDDDGIPGVSAGDTILYTVEVENTGNLSLTGVTPVDPIVTLALLSGDDDSDSELDPSETWVYQGSYTLTQTDIDSDGGGDGNIENTVTVSVNETTDRVANFDTPLNIAPAMVVDKSSVLNDDDGNPGLTAGDTATYTVTVQNTGNIRLTNVVVSDPLITLNYQSGDINGDNRLDVNETWTYQGTLIITQVDIDTLGGGDGDIDNTVTVNSDQLPPQTDIDELLLAPVSSLDLDKTAGPATQVFPTIYSFDYTLTLTNTGAVTQSGLRLEDDLQAAVAPATLVGTPSVTTSGFAGTGSVNPGYDGVGDIQLLTGDYQLAPGASGVVTISLTVDTGGVSANSLNTAFATSDQIATPIPSDDPTQTPGDPNDTSPTPGVITDTDGDGSPDDREDDTADRDGDGIPNATDYDPTGYFYCQADGRILSGGLITVENLTSGGSQTGIGASNGIVILRDGSDGQFQFHATQTGTYRLSYTLPPGGVASTDRLSSGTLDVTSLLPDNPGVLGSGQFGSTGLLADFTAAQNPFYTVFEIEAGDPAVFNNNIPLMFCGAPELSIAKSVSAGPVLQPDASSDVQYRVELTANGTEQVNSVQISDDLDAVFGAGNYTVTGTSIEAAPAGFAVDPFFNGASNTALLTTGNNLLPGERVSVLIDLNVTAPAGIFNNTAIGSGESPLDGSPVAQVSDNAEITIVPVTDGLTVEKTATPGSAPLGGPVTYTITVRNASVADVTGVDIVDLLPNGMSYIPGSAVVNGTPLEPLFDDAPRLRDVHTSFLHRHDDADPSGRALVWPDVTIPAGGSVTITLTTRINASATADEFINRAYVRDAITGAIVSNIAEAKVRLEIEPVFQCSDLIGRVFDDKNRDGYMDDGEPGLPGVRLATPNGLLIVTDKFGRYSIACGAIPDAQIGSNFLLKLDPATLPTGYQVTSENPRVVRLTRGKLSKLNFGAANLRLIRLEVSDASFVSGSTRPTQATIRELGQMLRILGEERSQLRIVYSQATNRDLARERLRALEGLIRQAWQQRMNGDDLPIETRLAAR